MYEHPIKRAGLSLNRIIYSNTKMVLQGFPKAKAQQFNVSFKYKAYENGKVSSVKCKLVNYASEYLLTCVCLCVIYSLHRRRARRGLPR